MSDPDGGFDATLGYIASGMPRTAIEGKENRKGQAVDGNGSEQEVPRLAPTRVREDGEDPRDRRTACDGRRQGGDGAELDDVPRMGVDDDVEHDKAAGQEECQK